MVIQIHTDNINEKYFVVSYTYPPLLCMTIQKYIEKKGNIFYQTHKKKVKIEGKKETLLIMVQIPGI